MMKLINEYTYTANNHYIHELQVTTGAHNIQTPTGQIHDSSFIDAINTVTACMMMMIIYFNHTIHTYQTTHHPQQQLHTFNYKLQLHTYTTSIHYTQTHQTQTTTITIEQLHH